MNGFQSLRERHGRSFAFAIVLVVVLYLAYGFFLTLRYWYYMTLFPGDVVYSEPILVYESRLLLSNQSLYPTGAANYFTAAIYGPLYYVLSASLYSLEPSSYTMGRILSLLGILMTSACIVLLTYRISRSTLALFLAAVLSIFPVSLVAFGPVIRPDSLHIGFDFVGLVIALVFWRSRLLYWSIPFFVLALFIKPSALPAPIAVALLLFLEDRKRALEFCLIGVTLSGAVLGLFVLIFGPGLLTHLFLGNVATYSFHAAFIQNPVAFVIVMLPLLTFAAVSFVFHRSKLLLAYFLLAFLLQVVLLGGKAGSSINYWSEPALVLVLSGAMGFAHYLNREGTRRRRFLLVGALVFLALFSYPSRGKAPIIAEAHQSIAQMRATVRDLAGKQRPRVFASNPGTVVLDSDLVQIPIADTFLYTQQVNLGRRDDQLLAGGIRSRAFGFIALTSTTPDFSDAVLSERLPRGTVQLVSQFYKLHRVVPGTPFSGGNVYFFLPR